MDKAQGDRVQYQHHHLQPTGVVVYLNLHLFMQTMRPGNQVPYLTFKQRHHTGRPSKILPWRLGSYWISTALSLIPIRL